MSRLQMANKRHGHANAPSQFFLRQVQEAAPFSNEFAEAVRSRLYHPVRSSPSGVHRRIRFLFSLTENFYNKHNLSYESLTEKERATGILRAEPTHLTCSSESEH